ncbi:hypothetical protein [Halospeciosus flavus]|uniref:EF-hand domain-containing protein n=1 Tax=Halospeciosus flavus TaxID=3032283 RepID=A0ABD5Z5F1_9EURY|nr:hypothetical protein [Halospeciosus flavus]
MDDLDGDGLTTGESVSRFLNIEGFADTQGTIATEAPRCVNVPTIRILDDNVDVPLLEVVTAFVLNDD